MNIAIVIRLLFACAFAGMIYALSRALQAGAESYAREHTDQTSRQFADIFCFIPPQRILELAWSAAGTLFLLVFLAFGNFDSGGGFLRGLLCGAVAGGAALLAPRWILLLMRRQRLLRFEAQLVDALMTMSNALRSGASILQAFEHIVKLNQNPISQEFGLFLQQTRLGVKLEDALENLARRVPSDDLLLMIRAIEIARQTGGNLTEVFDNIAATIRERLRIQAKIRALTAQGRFQGIIVGLTPLFLAFAMLIVSPQMMSDFLASATGLAIVAAVLLLDTLGALLIRKIIRIDI